MKKTASNWHISVHFFIFLVCFSIMTSRTLLVWYLTALVSYVNERFSWKLKLSFVLLHEKTEFSQSCMPTLCETCQNAAKLVIWHKNAISSKFWHLAPKWHPGNPKLASKTETYVATLNYIKKWPCINQTSSIIAELFYFGGTPTREGHYNDHSAWCLNIATLRWTQINNGYLCFPQLSGHITCTTIKEVT